MTASLYQPLYLLVVAFLSLQVFYKYYGRSGKAEIERERGANWQTFLLAFFLSVTIGLRPISGKYFVDMATYAHTYFIAEGLPFTFDYEAENLLFDNLFLFICSRSLGTEIFFVIIALIYFVGAAVACKRLFSQNVWAAYVIFLGAFSTFSYGTNGIKAGAAATLFLCALSYMENLKICIPLILLSLWFHHSMIMPIAAFALSSCIRNPKWYFIGWIFCLIMAAAHISFFQNLFARLVDDRGASYLSADSGYAYLTGFRPDFIAYSAMPVLVGYYAVYKKKIRLSKVYICLLNTYLCTNGIWMLCIYASFTNRIAYLSWLLYPIVLVYPFLNENWGASRYKTFAKIMLVHVCFTLFMDFIYYDILSL